MPCSNLSFSSFKPCCHDISLITGSCLQLAVQMCKGWEMILFLQAKFSPTQPYTARGQFFRSEHIRPLPNWTATTCSSDFWEMLISCPRLWEGSLLLQTSRVTGVNSPTRGRFTAMDRNHLSALCCLSPNRPDRAALGQSHRSEKCPELELKWIDYTLPGIWWYPANDCHLFMLKLLNAYLWDITHVNKPFWEIVFPSACGGKKKKRMNFKTSRYSLKGLPSQTFHKYVFIVPKWCTTTGKWANKIIQVVQMIFIIWLSSI